MNGATKIDQQVVAEGQPEQQPADHQVTRPAVRLPDEGPMQEQGHEQQVERVDLGDRRRGPDRRDGPEDERRGRREDGPDTQPLEDGHGRGEGARHQHRREEIGPERDRAKRHQLGEPRQEDVGRVAGRVRHAEHVRDGLHLAPVAERETGQERPRVDEERDQADRGGEAGGT